MFLPRARRVWTARGRRFYLFLLVAITLGAAGWPPPARAQPLGPLGVFELAQDVGTVHAPGSARFDAEKGSYRLTGGGANMWEAQDAFHFLRRSLNADLSLTATVRFSERKGNPHRKAGLMVRQGLEADAPYADAIVHADGLVSLQYRREKGGPTLEIQAPGKRPGPTTVRLERHGDLFTLSLARGRGAKAQFQPVGSVSVPLGDTVQAGLVVCSHEAKALASADFTEVALGNDGPVPADKRVLESRLEIITVPGGARQVVYQTRDHIEAPNWSRDGKTLLFNSKGKLYTVPARNSGTGNPTPTLLATGTAQQLNNDHGYSPDGKTLVISHEPKDESLIAILPAGGGEPRQVTALGPSYWHGWSPDGKTLAYCASRNGEYDIYTIAASAQMSRDEKRLTTAKGLDDGPDYSPDGKHIYFNSDRTGAMRIFRMNADGSDQRQITDDPQFGDWFPHPSPNGKWLVFLSYDKTVSGHPANKDVALRLISLRTKEATPPQLLAQLFGGQGTINVPSWSPDSRQVAFVSYRLVKP